jgi:hypothetical protein
MFTKTLTEFKTRVSALADIDGQIGAGSTFRHPTTLVDEIADTAYVRLRSLVTRRGFSFFVVPGTITALPTSAAETGESYSTISYPSATMKVIGLDVKQDGEWRRLKKLQFGMRRDYQRIGDDNYSRSPVGWDVLSHGSVATTAFTAGTIAIFPIPTGGDYRLWTLPHWTAIAGNDTYLFLYDDQSWYDYHVAQAVLELAGIRDNDGQKGRAAYALNMSQQAEAAIGEWNGDLDADGPADWTRTFDF